MTIAISCPHCGQRYAVDDRAAGKTLTCQGCQRPFTAVAESQIPQPAPAAVYPAAQSPTAPRPVVSAPQQPPGSLDLSELFDDELARERKRQEELEGRPEKREPEKKKKRKSTWYFRNGQVTPPAAFLGCVCLLMGTMLMWPPRDVFVAIALAGVAIFVIGQALCFMAVLSTNPGIGCLIWIFGPLGWLLVLFMDDREALQGPLRVMGLGLLLVLFAVLGLAVFGFPPLPEIK